MKQINQHPCAIHAEDIKQICDPLKKLNITYFGHAKIDKINSTFAGINNNPEFNLHYLSNQYYDVDIHRAGPDKFGSFIIWDSIKRTGTSDKLQQESILFGVNHTFTIVEKQNGIDNYFHFATHLDNPAINQVYLKNLDVLKVFICYFKDQINSSAELKKAYDIQFDINKNSEGYLVEHYSDELLHTSKSDILTNLPLTTKSKELFLPISLNHSKLTSRESEVLHLLVKGGTARTIKDTLFISERTVEHHIENIKRKLNVSTKSDLIKLALTQAIK